MKERRKTTRFWMVQENLKIITKEVIDNMKQRKGIRSLMGMIFMTMAALLIVMLMTQAPAQGVNCPTTSTADSDLDGLTDQQECDGLTLADSSLFPGGISAALPRAERLDPNTKDLFVVLIPATPSNLPLANPLEFIPKTQAEGGLAIATHPIASQASPNRQITATQKALRISESLDISTKDILGTSNYGTPNGLDNAIVYTDRIKNFVNSVYASVGLQPPAGFIDTYIKHTLAHEAGHMMSLTKTYNANYGGYHSKTGSGYILDQSVSYKTYTSPPSVTWVLGTKYSTADQSNCKLK